MKTKKVFTFAILAALLMVGFSSCKKAEDAPAAVEGKEEVAKLDCTKVDVAAVKAMAKDPKAVTDAEYESMINTLSCCEIDPKDLKLKNGCVFNEAMSELRKEKAKFPGLSELAPKLIKSESPQVRAYVYSDFPSITGVNEANLKLAKEATVSEKDPYGIASLISGVSNAGNTDPVIGKYFTDMAKHENAGVRSRAAHALGNSWSNKVDGAVDTLIALLNDADENVRKAACHGAGGLGSDKVIEAIVKNLDDPTLASIHAACVNGLLELWLNFPFYKNRSEAAYVATLNYFKKTPRTDKVPAWNSIGIYGLTGTGKDFETWKKEASYFKVDEFIAVMTDLVKDANMNWLGRSAALKSIAELGGKDALAKMEPIVNALNDDKASHLKDSFKKLTEKAAKAE